MADQEHGTGGTGVPLAPRCDCGELSTRTFISRGDCRTVRRCESCFEQFGIPENCMGVSGLELEEPKYQRTPGPCAACGAEYSHYIPAGLGKSEFYFCQPHGPTILVEEGQEPEPVKENPVNEVESDNWETQRPKVWKSIFEQGEEIAEARLMVFRWSDKMYKRLDDQERRIFRLEQLRDSLMTVIGFILTLSFIRAVARRVRANDET